jgi:hypothetical protein
MAARRPSPGHLDLATYPGAGMLDRLTRPWILGLSRLEEVKDVLRARRCPKSQEMVIRIVTKRESRTFGRIMVSTVSGSDSRVADEHHHSQLG